MGGREEPEHSDLGARVPLSSRTGFEPETCHSTFESIPSAPLRLTRTEGKGDQLAYQRSLTRYPYQLHGFGNRQGVVDLV